MKIKISTFKDGRKAYTTGGISIAVNKEQPAEVDEIEVNENIHKEFVKNPANVIHDKKRGFLIKKKEVEHGSNK